MPVTRQGKTLRRAETLRWRLSQLVNRMIVYTACFWGVAICDHALAGDLPVAPNIVLIFVDDMGWGDFSCFGNRDATTPNIDRLAAEGLAFEQFYVNSPICSPSRVAISTGQYPQRWQITSYLASRQANAKRGIANWLDPSAPMLARSLQNAGYATGHFGKWHMGGQRDVGDAPRIGEYGFDQSLTNFEGLGPRLLPLTFRPGQTEPGRHALGSDKLGEPEEITWMDRAKITGGFTQAAIKFIDKAHRQGKPFYINLWPDDVHSPFFPPRENWGENKRELYLAVLVEMDRQLAQLFDYVRDDEGLCENTLILICSDNGHEPGAGTAGPFKGCKTNLYEGGIRSSLVVWGPGLIAEELRGTRNDTSVFSAIDLVPSLLQIANVKSPTGHDFDGEPIADTLLGKSDQSRKAPLFFSRPPDRKNFYGFENLPDLAVREGRWKLLCDYDGGRPQLYDLKADRAETRNLADARSETVKRLTRRVMDWHAAMPKNVGNQGFKKRLPASTPPAAD